MIDYLQYTSKCKQKHSLLPQAIILETRQNGYIIYIFSDSRARCFLLSFQRSPGGAPKQTANKNIGQSIFTKREVTS